MPPKQPEMTTETRVRVLEAGHAVLTEQQAELVVLSQGTKACLQRGDERMAAIEAELLANSAVTAEIRDILNVARVGLRVLGAIGTAVRWAGYIATALGAIYVAVYMATHGGKTP